MLKYHPYKSDKQGILSQKQIYIYIGASGCSDFTIHKDEQRKQRYINRHKTKENWSKSGIHTAGFGLVGCFGMNQQ